MAYGYIQTADNVARQLKELNRDYTGRKTWGKLYGAIDIQRQDAIADLTYDYEEQLAKAYSTAYGEKSLIANSALGSGFKDRAESDIDLALQEAFASYKRNYISSADTVNANALKLTGEIDKALTDEAQNYVDYEASAYSYLQYLYNQAVPPIDAKYEANSELATLFKDDPNWSKFVVTEKDAEGVETKRLMTEQELRARNYDLDDKGQGTLNRVGVDFYDQMLNGLSQEGNEYGFHAWLSKENPELYNWSVSGDAYNVTDAGTKMGSFKKMMGLQSTDDEYKFIERFGGLSPDEIKANVNSFTSGLKDIVNTGERDDTYKIMEIYGNALDSLTSYIDKLNLTDEQSEPLTKAIEKMKIAIDHVDVRNTSHNEAWAVTVESLEDAIDEVKVEFNSGRYGNAVLSAMNGAVDVVLTFVIGAFEQIARVIFPNTMQSVYNLPGSNSYKETVSDYKEDNRKAIAALEEDYLDILTLLASYASPAK